MSGVDIHALDPAGKLVCGVFHPPESVHHPDGSWTPGEIAVLRADPDLVVTDSSGDTAETAPPGILAQAIEALRTAEPGEIRAFFKQIGEDQELQARIESVMDETAHGVIAINKLDPKNPEHFTKSGVPRTDALEALLDRPVSSDQRDAWWEDFQEAQKNGAGE